MNRVTPRSLLKLYLLCIIIAACVFTTGCSSNKASGNGKNNGPAWVKQTPLNYTDHKGTDSVTLIPGANYEAGNFKQWLAGGHYRQTWITPVTVPVIDLTQEKGGLKPLKSGGNMQSLTLHLEGQGGKRYVLRSVQKNPIKTLPEELRKTFVVDVAQDQVSTLHPYGALAAAKLADAAGVYHTNPRLVFVPATAALGEFQGSHGGMLAIFEEKPGDDWSDEKTFGNSKKIVDTDEVLKNIESDITHRVDEHAFARARLLDILIGDWDRSEDQWAWGTFENGSSTTYKPIPRDRDQAFVKMDGFFPWFFSRKWAARKYQGFNEDVHDMKGLNYNGRWIDRSFLTRLTLQEWKSIADSVKASVTDEVIESTIRQLPASHVYGNEMIKKLKKRRDDLTRYAEEYYKVLAEEVDVVGSKGTELFEVVRVNKDTTIVRVYKCTIIEKEIEENEIKQKTLEVQGEKVLMYERAFRSDETDEIRLYGSDGNDIFDIKGEARRGMLVRIVGGEGYDRISDRSEVKGWRKRTKIYDITDRNEFVLGDEAKDLSSYDVRVNDHNRMEFNYDEVGPRALLDYNADDGLFIGGGLYYKNYSFRKKPYSHLQEFVAAGSVKTGASIFRYKGDFVNLFRKWDMNVDAVITPYYATYFYGFGNTTLNTDALDDEFNLVRTNQAMFKPAAKRANKRHRFTIGPSYRYVQVLKRDGSLLASPEVKLAAHVFEPRHFGAVEMDYTYRNVSNEIMPRQGLVWISSLSWNVSLDKTRQTYSRIGSEVSAYIPLSLPLSPVLALRAGGASNVGDFEFYQANYLGGQGVDKGNLRGYRRYRFAGRSAAYQNTELRLKLLDLQLYGEAGVFGFVDHGRVWVDNENSSKLHRGYGAGLWIVPLNKLVVACAYSASEEDALLNLHLGFLF